MYKLAAQGLTRDSRGQSYVHVTNAGDASRATPMTLLRLEGGRDGKDDLKVEVMQCTLYDVVTSSNDVKVIDNIEKPDESMSSRDFTYIVKATSPTGTQLAALTDFSVQEVLESSTNLYYKCKFPFPGISMKAVDTNKLRSALKHWWTMNTNHNFYATYLKILRLDVALITSSIQVNSNAKLYIELIDLAKEDLGNETFYEADEELPSYKETGLSKTVTIPSGSTIAYQYTQIKVNEAGKATIVPRESCGSVGHQILAATDDLDDRAAEKGEMDCALVVLELVANNKYRLVEKNLHRILKRPEVKGLPVSVLSIAGAFRTGKTFILNFFLKFLSGKHEKCWLTEPSEAADHNEFFEWRGGNEAHTMGIHMWSKPFIVERSSSDKVAVLLMDTQGTFDHQLSSQSTAIIFALSTLLSSVQMFNISNRIGEDSLRHLEYFTEYGKLAVEDKSSKPFQDLMFLIRDHPRSGHLLKRFTSLLRLTEKPPEFGAAAGAEYLRTVLKYDSSKQSEEQKNLRELIGAMFENVTCFLLPRPGEDIADGFPFDYKNPMEETSNHKFLTHVQDLVYTVLHPNHLIIKEQNGTPLTTETYLQTFKKLVSVFTSGELPRVKTVIEASADADNIVAAAKGKEAFIHLMQEFASRKRIDMLLEDRELQQTIEQLKVQAIDVFNSAPKIGGDKYSPPHRMTLAKDLDMLAEKYREQLADIPSRAAAARNCESAVASCLDRFNKSVHKFKEASEKKPTLEKERITQFYEMQCKKMETHFKNQPYLGNETVWGPYLEELRMEVTKTWKPIAQELSKKPTLVEAQEALNKAQKEAEHAFRSKVKQARDSELKEDKIDVSKFKKTVERYKQDVTDSFSQEQSIGGDALCAKYLKWLSTNMDEEISESIKIVEKRAKDASSNLEACNFCYGQYAEVMDTFLSEQRAMTTVEKELIKKKHMEEKRVWRERMKKYHPYVTMEEKYLQRFEDACEKKYQQICHELKDKPTQIQLEQTNTACVEKCYTPYKTEFKNYIDVQVSLGIYCPKIVERNHKACEQHAMEEFEISAVIGGAEMKLMYKKKLQDYIDKFYDEGYKELKKSACTEDEARRKNRELREECNKNYLKAMRKEAYYSWQKKPWYTSYKGWFEDRHPGISRQCLADFDSGKTGSYEFSLGERDALKKDIDRNYLRFIAKNDEWFDLSHDEAMRYYRGELKLGDE